MQHNVARGDGLRPAPDERPVDDEELRRLLTGMLARLDVIESALTQISRKTTVILDDVWGLRHDPHERWAGVERRRAHHPNA